MKCIIKNVAIVFVVAIAIAGLAGWIPQEWGGYATGGVLASIAIVAAVLFLRGLFRNSWRNLGRMSHEQSEGIRADIRAGLGVITDEQPQLQDREITVSIGKMAPDVNHPVMVDRAHLQHIRGNETMPFAGYDQEPAKDQERFGVVQQPELTAGNEVDAIWANVSEKQPVGRNS